VTNDDLLFRHRVSLFARAGQVGVSQACRELGYHRSTYYRWRPRVERHGLEILRPRERRPPRMPNQIPTWLEQRILAFALGQPGFGARRIASDLALPMWGRLAISASGVSNVLRRHGLSTRRRRLALVAGYAAPPAPPPRKIPEPRHLDAEIPGDLVQFDCFYVGRLSDVRGRVWQYTAIDVASSYLWAELHTTPLNPAARHTSALARRVASDLADAGWNVRAVLTDNGSEFKSSVFRQAIQELGAEHRFIRAGRPQTNGCVERVQRTVLEECWRPSFARSMVPSSTGLKRDLDAYVTGYNWYRSHNGWRNKGRTPASIVYGARKMRPR
jgi:transposase InsO family protein